MSASPPGWRRGPFAGGALGATAGWAATRASGDVSSMGGTVDDCGSRRVGPRNERLGRALVNADIPRVLVRRLGSTNGRPPGSPRFRAALFRQRASARFVTLSG